jgi:hypothetical protein
MESEKQFFGRRSTLTKAARSSMWTGATTTETKTAQQIDQGEEWSGKG